MIAARRYAFVCVSVCLGLYKVHSHCDSCEAIHACDGVVHLGAILPARTCTFRREHGCMHIQV